MSNYKPNHIPKNERIFNALWGTGLLVWSTYGLIVGELIFPGRRGREDTVFTELGLYFVAAGMVLGAANMFLLIVDHYDKRDNEINYKYASRALISIVIVLVIAAIVSNEEPTDKKASSTPELAPPIINLTPATPPT